MCSEGKVRTSELVSQKEPANLIIENDKSISREHASISISESSEEGVSNPSMKSVAELKDLSKYGTFLNDKKITPNIQMKHGDKIKFGVYDSIYHVEWIPLNFSVFAEEQKSLMEKIKQIDGRISDQYNNEITVFLTDKQEITETPENLLLSLIHSKPIITSKYIDDILSKKLVKELPDPKQYPSPNFEKLKSSLSPNAERENIFKEKFFLFFDEKIKKFEKIICEAGGKVLNGENETIDEIFFETHKNHILIETTGNKKEQLLEFGFEMINEIEIVNLIITTDTKLYCNPKEPRKLLKRKKSSEKQTLKKKQKIVESEPAVEIQKPKLPPPLKRIKTEEDSSSEEENSKLEDEELPTISVEYMETTMIEEEVPEEELNDSYNNTTPTRKCKYNAKKFVKALPHFKAKMKLEPKDEEKSKESNEDFSIQFDSDMLTFYPEDSKIFEDEQEKI
eukprot:gene4649-8222_t